MHLRSKCPRIHNTRIAPTDLITNIAPRSSSVAFDCASPLIHNARLVVAPLQDLLSLDNEARFNTPGTIENNWRWRLSDFDHDFSKALAKYGESGSQSGRSFSASTGLFDD